MSEGTFSDVAAQTHACFGSCFRQHKEFDQEKTVKYLTVMKYVSCDIKKEAIKHTSTNVHNYMLICTLEFFPYGMRACQ